MGMHEGVLQCDELFPGVEFGIPRNCEVGGGEGTVKAEWGREGKARFPGYNEV